MTGTFLPAASPAKIFPRLANVLASKARKAVFGPKWRDSLATFDPGTSSWKTSQACLVQGWTAFAETWPRSGMIVNGIAYRLPALVPYTSAIEFGLWLDPVDWNPEQGGQPLVMWPTPRAADGAKGTRTLPGAIDDAARRTTGNDLPTSVLLWPTPQAHDTRNGNPERVGRFGKRHGGRNLNDEVAKWPTPTIRGNNNRKGLTKDSGDGLATAVKRHLPTPAQRDYRYPNSKSYSERGGGSNGEQLPNHVGGPLNPPWVEWLMGFPIGWTELDPSEMPLSRRSRRDSSKP